MGLVGPGLPSHTNSLPHELTPMPCALNNRLGQWSQAPTSSDRFLPHVTGVAERKFPTRATVQCALSFVPSSSGPLVLSNTL